MMKWHLQAQELGTNDAARLFYHEVVSSHIANQVSSEESPAKEAHAKIQLAPLDHLPVDIDSM